MIQVSQNVAILSSEIARRSIIESNFFPIDREFLVMNDYVHEIKKINIVEFIFFNVESTNQTYAKLLFLSLPEIWESITIDDMEYLVANFSNDISYFIIIEFTYKYLEIDILEIVLRLSQRNVLLHKEIKNYLNLQWNVLIKSEEERELLEYGYEKEVYGYNILRWNYIKQVFLLDIRVKPAMLNFEDLRLRITRLIG